MGALADHDVVRLEGDLTIAAAAGQAAGLLGALDAGRDLTLDLARVVDCDSAGVQLLLALRCSLAQRGRALRLAGVDGSVEAALDTLGLRDAFAIEDGCTETAT